ncbi:hypothetical protein Q1695_003362 [Nippostrongylus brasiliensis]|nr:hypothetical protein Q1695_003362 [Nippostrongylus brasiliensis]
MSGFEVLITVMAQSTPPATVTATIGRRNRPTKETQSRDERETQHSHYHHMVETMANVVDDDTAMVVNQPTANRPTPLCVL